MPVVGLACALLVVATTVLHYEVLRLLYALLPSTRIAHRFKLVGVILGTLVAHIAEMALYGAVLYALISGLGIGHLGGRGAPSLATCMYFSAETYTSLGFGDLTPVGPVRLLAGIEALNGLLLIGWSASFTYMSMERLWRTDWKVPPDAGR
jgi:hypothetical protein